MDPERPGHRWRRNGRHVRTHHRIRRRGRQQAGDAHLPVLNVRQSPQNTAPHNPVWGLMLIRLYHCPMQSANTDIVLAMKGKVALVTGVGRKRGIGAAICQELAKNGADVFFTYWHQYDLGSYAAEDLIKPEEFANELRSFGVRAASLEVDLSKPDSAEKVFEAVKKELGAPDILINNAAVSTHQLFLEVTADLLDKHYAVNVRATTLLCKEFAKQGRQGKIINLTSGQALGVMKDELPYTITKASVEMLTQQIAPELSSMGITINAFDPGPTDTGWMTDEVKEAIRKDSPSGTIHTPEDVAKQICNLLKSTEIGQIIHAER